MRLGRYPIHHRCPIADVDKLCSSASCYTPIHQFTFNRQTRVSLWICDLGGRGLWSLFPALLLGAADTAPHPRSRTAGTYATGGCEETLLKTEQVLAILELPCLALALQEDHRKFA